MDGRDRTEREARWRRYLEGRGAAAVAPAQGAVAGFVSWVGQRDDGLRAQGIGGEVSALYVAPDRVRQGLGGALLSHALADLRAEGHAATSLEAYADNADGCAFYAAQGGVPWRRWVEERPYGLRLPIVVYVWGAPDHAR